MKGEGTELKYVHLRPAKPRMTPPPSLRWWLTEVQGMGISNIPFIFHDRHHGWYFFMWQSHEDTQQSLRMWNIHNNDYTWGLDWALWASHCTSHVLDYLIPTTLWDRHCYGHFTDENIEVRKGKNNFQVAAQELKSRSIQLQSEHFQPLRLRPPPSSQWLARCSDLSNTAFHLTWYQCPNSASCTFIFKRRSIVSPHRMDLESWARASETRSHRARAAFLGLPFMEGAQAFHFLSSTVTVKNWPLYLLK